MNRSAREGGKTCRSKDKSIFHDQKRQAYNCVIVGSQCRVRERMSVDADASVMMNDVCVK